MLRAIPESRMICLVYKTLQHLLRTVRTERGHKNGVYYSELQFLSDTTSASLSVMQKCDGIEVTAVPTKMSYVLGNLWIERDDR